MGEWFGFGGTRVSSVHKTLGGVLICLTVPAPCTPFIMLRAAACCGSLSKRRAYVTTPFQHFSDRLFDGHDESCCSELPLNEAASLCEYGDFVEPQVCCGEREHCLRRGARHASRAMLKT